MENANTEFCLDIGHCFCSANAQNIEPYEYLKEFLKFNPKLYHLTDNDFYSPIDKHLHFGEGNFDIEKILNYLPNRAKVTLETVKNSQNNLNDYIKRCSICKKIRFYCYKS